jgi:hypothetical protein
VDDLTDYSKLSAEDREKVDRINSLPPTSGAPGKGRGRFDLLATSPNIRYDFASATVTGGV